MTYSVPQGTVLGTLIFILYDNNEFYDLEYSINKYANSTILSVKELKVDKGIKQANDNNTVQELIALLF